MYKNKIMKAFWFSAGLAVAATSTLSYAANVPTGTKLAKVQELTRNNGSEVATIDPQKVEGVPGSNVVRDLFEGLVIQDGDGNIIPGIAKSWETKDNKTYIFHLRDAKWSNGDPVTAEDFAYSFRRAVDPSTASPYAWYVEMTTMKNAAAIISGKKDKSTLGVKAIDPHTLEIQLDKPIPYFVKMMSHTTMAPVHKATVEKWGDEWTKPEHFVSDGAYVLKKWVVNERMVLERNPEYWDNKDTVINQVTYLPVENRVAAMNRFLAGDMQITYEMPIEQYRRLKKEHPEDIKTTGYLCSYYYGFNTSRKPLNDVRVREALSYAIDRNIIANAIMGQGQKPAYDFTPDIVAGFTPKRPAYAKLTQKELNEKAVGLLKEAGYDKSHPLKITLLYNTADNHKKIATAVQSMWKKTLGVDVTLENEEWKTFLETRREGNFDVTRAGWCGDYNEASTFLNVLMSNNGNNDSRYYNKDYDAIMNKAMVVTTEKERNKLYNQAEMMLARDMPVAPIYQYVNSRLVSPTVGGYPMHNAQGNIYAKDLYIKAK
ncbi:ABC transporter substrate-binding protein [Vibrio profundum]|uniref:ABC transporter substrate-binding protein n=1 Tax=Vibrio profundum TaxID=2910247 RepID=UPI003D0E10F8